MSFSPEFIRRVSSVLSRSGRAYESEEYIADRLGAAIVNVHVGGEPRTFDHLGDIHDNAGDTHMVLKDAKTGRCYVLDHRRAIHEV